MIYLEMVNGHVLRKEETLLKEYFDACGYREGKDWKKLSLRQMRRFTGGEFKPRYVSGSIDFVKAALLNIDRAIPEDDCYPRVLRTSTNKFFKRGTPTITSLSVNTTWPIFLKPAVKTKLFTGRVFKDEDEFALIRIRSDETLWTTPIVNFVSEYRFYVINGVISFCAQYSGESDQEIDILLVQEAVDRLASVDYLNYAVDFGITDEGETELVEVNDGFSLGCYGDFPTSSYHTLLLNRWKEMAKG